MKTIRELVDRSTLPEGLIRAVVRQAGGWEYFKMIAPMVMRNGHKKDWSGFEYHTETSKFYITYRDLIRQVAHHVAEEGGQSTIKMIHNFRDLSKEFSEDEIGTTLYGPKSKIDIQIANALACFVLEKVAQAYINIIET